MEIPEIEAPEEALEVEAHGVERLEVKPPDLTLQKVNSVTPASTGRKRRILDKLQDEE